jgi:endoglucanase
MKKQSARNLRRAGELLLLLALIVIVPSSLPNVSAQVNNLPWLHVEGGRIVDESGSVVVLRGAAVEDPYYLKYIEKRFDGRDFMELSQNWHVNVIKVPVCPDLWEHNPNYTQELLDPVVDWGRQYGTYILLGWHADGNPITGEVPIPDWGSTPPWSGNPYNPNMTLATRFWNQIAERYKDMPWVIYEIFNEPTYISWQQWRPVAEQLVDVIQSHNPRATIFVPGVGWGYDLRGVGSDPVQRQNIVYETHPYPGQGAYVGPWETFFGYLAGSYPLFAGEWGFVPGSSNWNLNATAENYGTALLEYMANLGMSWAGWSWSASWSPRMLQNWNYQPTTFGQLIKDVLAAGLPTSAGKIVSVSVSPGSVSGKMTVTFAVTVENTGNIAWSSATVLIKIYRPDGSLADTASHRQIHLENSQIQPGNQYTYETSWKTPSKGSKGVWHYEVFVNSGSVLIASSTDIANTITVN